jgi:hypothetical protein
MEDKWKRLEELIDMIAEHYLLSPCNFCNEGNDDESGEIWDDVIDELRILIEELKGKHKLPDEIYDRAGGAERGE